MRPGIKTKTKWSDTATEIGSGERFRWRITRTAPHVAIFLERVLANPPDGGSGHTESATYIHSDDDARWIRDTLTEFIDDIHDIEALKAEIEQLRFDRDDIAGLRQALDDLLGPHCTSCGSSIDPDICHCGEDVAAHAGGFDSHAPVPMGCVCHLAIDYTPEAHIELAKCYIAGGESPPINTDTTAKLARTVIEQDKVIAALKERAQNLRSRTWVERSAHWYNAEVYEAAKVLVDIVPGNPGVAKTLGAVVRFGPEVIKLVEAVEKAREAERKRAHHHAAFAATQHYDLKK